MSRRLMCACGTHISFNTLHSHVKSGNCLAPQSYQVRMKNICELRKLHGNARPYIKPVSAESIQVVAWFQKAAQGEIEIGDLYWGPLPRQRGVARPSTLTKSSISRRGDRNPSARARLSKITFTVEEVRSYAQSMVNSTQWQFATFAAMRQEIESKYPNYKCLFTNLVVPTPSTRGHNKDSVIWADLLQQPIEEVCRLKRLRRGMCISRGQKASATFLAIASKIGSSATSSWRLTKPQRQLFNMVQQFDSSAQLEYTVKYGNKYKSFDIFSPKIGTLIEMHGHVWHRHGKKALEAIVERNIANDTLKAQIAAELGFHLAVFWDDQQAEWLEGVRKLYEKD